ECKFETDFLKINPLLDYEILFFVSTDSQGGGSGQIDPYNSSKELLDWVEVPKLLVENIPFTDTWYLYRLVIYGCESEFQRHTSMKSGSNGKMSEETTQVKISFNFAEGMTKMKGLKFKILKTDYE